ncbi:MAG: ferrous iron transport protein B, partial [Lachnospiraceae bacterium]|nr:ferrous iron transport protein B [Lachnospiraceae bacterium]
LNAVTDSGESLLAIVGKLIAPVFSPLGFNDWRAATALICGFTAKEAVVSSLGVLTGTSMANLSGTLSSLFSTASAASFLVFTLLYTPCVAAVAAIRRELGSAVKTVGIVCMQCGVAWFVACLVYQVLQIVGV